LLHGITSDLSNWEALLVGYPGQPNPFNPSTREAAKQLLSRVFYNQKTFVTYAGVEQFFNTRMSVGDGYTIKRLTESRMRRQDLLDDRLPALKRPTLLIQGRQDKLTPAALSERLKQEITGSELLMLDNCGHAPPIKKPNEFNAAAVRFLSERR